MKHLLINEAQKPGFFIARVNACFQFIAYLESKQITTIVVNKCQNIWK